MSSGSSASRPGIQENIPEDGVGTAGCWTGRLTVWEGSLDGSLPFSSQSTSAPRAEPLCNSRSKRTGIDFHGVMEKQIKFINNEPHA